MKHDHFISDEFLNAFIDDQLDMIEKSRIFDLIEQDETLKIRVCELRGLKKMVQHAYQQPPLPQNFSKKPKSRFRLPHAQVFAACLILMIGGVSGWFAHHLSGYGGPEREMMRLLQSAQRNDINTEPSKLMIHVGTSNQTRIKTALDVAENLLAKAKRENKPLEVEIIANGGGLALLRADTSPFANRIHTMKESYPGLTLMACGQAIKDLRAKGVDVRLLPSTAVSPSAIKSILIRMKQGWGYIKV